MKKLIIFLLIGHNIVAQQFKMVSFDSISLPEGRKAYYPIASNSGNSVLYSSENYKGLFLLDLRTGNETIISESEGAGFKPLFSPDDSTIYFVTNYFKNKLRFSSLKSLALGNSNEEKTIISGSRKTIQPFLIDNSLGFSSDLGLRKQRLQNIKSGTPRKLAVSIENRKLVIHQNGTSKVIDPANVESYIWPSISPNESRIAFYAIGKGAFVSNIDGSNLMSLGEIEALNWIDNNFLVGMISQDDGHQIIKSKIVIFDIKNNSKQIITDPELIAMYPTVSSFSKSILFNTIDGNLYIIKYQIE